MSQMHASSRKLAAALAARLNEVVPGLFRVQAEGEDVGVYAQDSSIGGSGAPGIVEDDEDDEDDDDRTLGEKIETATRAVLDAVQDVISEYLCVPWPSLDGVAMAMPGVRVDTELVHLWYGADESAPAISIPAIRISEITGLDGTASVTTVTT
ncbi:MAG: hypothetical protein ACR2OU_06945 [Thermomicrobiales bacterium]